MSAPDTFRATGARALDRLHARLASRAAPARGFRWQPEPRTIGFFARGRQLIAGNLMFAGHLVEAPDTLPWDLTMPDTAFADGLHGFTWLDDLAAVGDVQARALAQAWLFAWIDRYGGGAGPGWTPDLTGRRIIRWVHHALMLLRGTDAARSAPFFRAVAAQARFLHARAASAAPGVPRIEALTGLLYAALSLDGLERHADPARRALAAECARQVDESGGIPTRSPEALLEVFTLLTWAREALARSGAGDEPALSAALGRIAPTLRALRHADGGLARFHGGGRGIEGRLDAALAEARIRPQGGGGLAMGFARLARARTTVIMDAAPPPVRAASVGAHASTLAVEVTSGRRPLIVNCGAGADFGASWRRAGRATPSHSTLCLAGRSSASLKPGPRGRGEWLSPAPTRVPVQLSEPGRDAKAEGGHDGYVAAFGLTHARTLTLSADGRTLEGEDYLVALDDAAKRRFDAAFDDTRLAGIVWRVHFHLHPEVDVAVDLGGAAASMALRSGEIWVLRFDGPAQLELEPSVYLEAGRLRPRPTKQVVLSGRAMEYATRVRWSLAKAHDTALAVRDLAEDRLEDAH